MISQENKIILIKRAKSLLWRIGGIIAASGLSFIAENLGLFELHPEVVVFVGLVIGELTKFINGKFNG